MKFIKQLSLIAFSSVFILSNNVFANTQQTETKQQSTQKNVSAKVDKNLKLFNDSFAIKLISRTIGTDNAGKPAVTVKYELTNKSNRNIKAANWISAYTFNNQVIAVQNVQINFENPSLKAKNQVVVDLKLSLESFSEQARQLLLSPQTAIGVINGAKRLDFTKGKSIIVK